MTTDTKRFATDFVNYLKFWNDTEMDNEVFTLLKSSSEENLWNVSSLHKSKLMRGRTELLQATRGLLHQIGKMG